MPESPIGHLAIGINESFFSGLTRERRDEQDQKDKEQARRLAGLQLLLKDPGTTEDGVVDTLEQIAKESGIHKEPLVRHVIDNMRSGMSRQVSSGPAEIRTVDRPQFGIAPPVQAPQGLQVPERKLMAVPEEPTMNTGVAAVAAQPTAAAPDLLGLQRQSSVLTTVPTEETYQPTRRYGDLTQAEAEDLRGNTKIIAQQKAMLDRQAELARIAGDEAAEKDARRQKSAIELEETKQKGRIDLASRNYENKKALLEPAAQAKVEGERLAYRKSLILQGRDPVEAEVLAAQHAQGLADITLEAKKQQIAQSKASIEHWKRQDANQLLAINKRGEGIGGATAGMSASEARYLRAQTMEVVPDLNDARKQLDSLYRLRTAVNGTLKPGAANYDTSYDAQIAAQESRRDAALEKINGARQEILGQRQATSSVPSQPGTSKPPAGRKPLGGPLGLP